MFNLLRLGQGPRPDLLEKEYQEKASLSQPDKSSKPEKEKQKAPSDEKPEKNLKIQHKDIVAMIIALFQVLLPWIIGGILIYFLFIFFLTKNW
mgnify:CR=1 FL=1